MNKLMKKEIENIRDSYDLRKYITKKIDQEHGLHETTLDLYSARLNILDALEHLNVAYRQCKPFLTSCFSEDPKLSIETFNNVLNDLAVLMVGVSKKADESCLDHEESDDGLQLLFDEIHGLMAGKEETK